MVHDIQQLKKQYQGHRTDIDQLLEDQNSAHLRLTTLEEAMEKSERRTRERNLKYLVFMKRETERGPQMLKNWSKLSIVSQSSVCGSSRTQSLRTESGRQEDAIDLSLSSSMPLNRFPRQACTMLSNDIETTIQNNQSTGLHNWAKSIKECLHLLTITVFVMSG